MLAGGSAKRHGVKYFVFLLLKFDRYRHPNWSIKAGGKVPVWPLHYTFVGRIKSGSAIRQYALESDFNRSFPVCKCYRIYRILLMHAPSCRNIELLWKIRTCLLVSFCFSVVLCYPNNYSQHILLPKRPYKKWWYKCLSVPSVPSPCFRPSANSSFLSHEVTEADVMGNKSVT